VFAYNVINGRFFATRAWLPYARLANAASGFTKKAAFDDSIFKRVERDDCQPPAASQLRDRRRNETFEGSQLIVNRDSQRLKSSRCGMYAPSTRYIEGSDDKLCKLRRRRNRFSIALPRDCASDLAGPSFLSVFKDQISQLALCEFIHKHRRGPLAVLIHSHVEWRVGGKTKASFTSLELQRRYSEISQNAARFGYPFPGQNISDAFEVGVNQLNPAFKYR